MKFLVSDSDQETAMGCSRTVAPVFFIQLKQGPKCSAPLDSVQSR